MGKGGEIGGSVREGRKREMKKEGVGRARRRESRERPRER